MRKEAVCFQMLQLNEIEMHEKQKRTQMAQKGTIHNIIIQYEE